MQTPQRDARGRFTLGNTAARNRPTKHRTAPTLELLRQLATLNITEAVAEFTLDTATLKRHGSPIEPNALTREHAETLLAIKQAAANLLRHRLESIDHQQR